MLEILEIEKKLPVMLNACKHREDQFNIIIGGIRHLKSVYYKIGLESNVSIIYNDTYNYMVNDFTINDCLFLILFRSEYTFSGFSNIAVL